MGCRCGGPGRDDHPCGEENLSGLALELAVHVQLGVCTNSKVLSGLHAHFDNQTSPRECPSDRTFRDASLIFPLNCCLVWLLRFLLDCLFVCVTSSEWLWHGPQHESCWHILFPFRNRFHIQFGWWGVIRPRALCIGSGGVSGIRARRFLTGIGGRASVSLCLERLLMPVPVAAAMQYLADKLQTL